MTDVSSPVLGLPCPDDSCAVVQPDDPDLVWLSHAEFPGSQFIGSGIFHCHLFYGVYLPANGRARNP